MEPSHRAKTGDELKVMMAPLVKAPPRRIVIQFKQPLSKDDRRDLADSGITLLNYLGDHAYFARLDKNTVNLDALADLGLISNTQQIQTRWKLHPFLARGEIPTWAVTNRTYAQALREAGGDPDLVDVEMPRDPLIVVYVMFHPDVMLFPFGHLRVAQHEGTVYSVLNSINGLVVEMPLSRVDDLASEDDVQYVEPAMPRMSSLNDSSRALVGADIVQAPPYSLSGNGVTVLVYDSGTALPSHSDFGSRLTVRDSSGILQHSTHVSGIIGGDGTASSGLFRGIAPNVLMESYGFEQSGGASAGFLFSDPGDLESDYSDAINNHGVDIANNSIGSNIAAQGFPCEWTGDYGVTSALIDAIVRGSLGTPMLVIWANGNERQVTRCGDTYKTTAPPSCAKNHITVGAVNSNDDSMTSFSSWGPCDDGRLKPDLVAPGCQSNGDFAVTSTSELGGYTELCGTSMSAPVVTGIGALLLEEYRSLFPTQPDFLNSTLKAILTHSAVDLGPVGPDYQFGYGSVRAQAAVDLLQSTSFLESQVDQGGIVPTFIEVLPGTTELKVTIAWDDAPASPNVSFALVNDLDLLVIDPSGGTHFPWTLDPANPTVAAVNTQPDRINNIEQVVINAPVPGIYRVEVRGFLIPVGPQIFSICTSPVMIPCSSTGTLTLEREAYACDVFLAVQVIDCDLNKNDGVVETVSVSLSSTTEPTGEMFLLTETDADSAVFKIMVPLGVVDSTGLLQVSDGDVITATYVDADDGEGNFNVNVIDTAVTDCVTPSALSIQVTNVTSSSATITVDMSEVALAELFYGTDCLTPASSMTDDRFDTQHVFTLTELQDDTTYFFSLNFEDLAANVMTDDNGGLCFSFKTVVAVDYFTELFDEDDLDLNGKSLTFTPNGSPEFYQSCVIPSTGLPISTDSANIVFIPDDAFQELFLTGGKQLLLYGTAYGSFFIGSNGYLTFGVGDDSRSESVATHFSLPRISGLFDDLNPASAGTMSWEQLDDRVVVTYEDIPRFLTSLLNTFQIEMFFTGEIRITWAKVQVAEALVGLSAGTGIPVNFVESNLSLSNACDPRSPNANGAVEQVISNRPLVIILPAVDDGLPLTPGVLSYTITSLPQGPLRDADNDHLIVSGDLPYLLNGGGNTLNYVSMLDFVGLDPLAYNVDDGGVAPTGGVSNIATITIDVVAPILGDANFDGIVNVVDLLIVLIDWGTCPGCEGDTNGDGIVNVVDLLNVLINWGTTLPPPPDPGSSLSSGKSLDEELLHLQDELILIPDVGPKPRSRVFVNDGLLAPADVGGIIEIDRNYLQTEAGQLVIQLAGDRPWEEYDLLLVRGRATLGGSLVIQTVAPFTPRIGDKFVFLIADGIDGRFEEYQLPEVPPGAAYETTYEEKAVFITLVEAELGQHPADMIVDVRASVPSTKNGEVRRSNSTRFGDLNRDHELNSADVSMLLEAWGRRSSRADLNRDRIVDAMDLLLLLEELSNTGS